MKIQVFGGIAVVSMALTSALVWSATSQKSETTAKLAPASSALNPSTLSQSTTPLGTPNNGNDHPVPTTPLIDRSSFTAGKTLMMEGRLGHATLPANSASDTYLFVEVKADANQVANVAAPLELAIVIDRSGSMRGKRLENALGAARTAVERSRDGDIISVLIYNTRTEVVVAPTVVDATTRPQITRKLRNIRAQGDTCISCAVESGMRLLGRGPNMVSRILLLSDGEATHGEREVEGFGRIADRSRALGVSITSIGVDIDYNERIMAALARRSNGRHYFVENALNLATIFEQEMQSLASTVASNTELHVSLAPGISLDHVYDRTFRPEGNGVSVSMGSFTAGESKTLLMRVRVPHGQVGERAIADARLSYTDLVKGDAGQCEGELVAQITDDASKVSPLDGLVSMRISRSETAEALEQANELFRAGRGQEARGVLLEKREALKNKKGGWQNAPAARRADFDADFTRQSKALTDAEDAFVTAGDEAAASGGGKASSSRSGRKQIRRNQEEAVNLAF